MMATLFWGSVFLVAYPYVVYPLLVALIGAFRPRPVAARPIESSITLLIPAYNEARHIAATVQNKLDQNYPQDKLQIIVVSDGSSDGTDEIVKGFADRGVLLLRREGREGKAAALNAAILHATGEIVVFSDANSLFDVDALTKIAANFADPEVGYVTGALRFSTSRLGVSGIGGGVYLRYENWVRRLETRAGSIIGVNGGVDAIRRALYVVIPNQLITDFVLPLSVIEAGHRVVFDATARAIEAPNEELASEFRMRVRVALRSLQGLEYMRRLLNPVRFPLPAFCLISHKALRYSGFVFMALALISNTLLAASSPFYRYLLAVHVSSYLVGLIGLVSSLPDFVRKFAVVPGYLVMSNAAFALAAFKFARGDKMATWKPRGG